jgi:Uma2 family endonuclease
MKRVVKNNVPRTWHLSDFLKHLGNISPKRIRMYPWPGTAVESDVTALQVHQDRLCELVEGVLVEKVMGYQEGYLAAMLIRLLGNFAEDRDLGAVYGADGTVRLMPGLVRVPDVSFVSWDKLPGRMVPKTAIPDVVPDLAVEVLSEGNTEEEMKRKLKDYFFCGVRLVWYVDPRNRRVSVYTSPESCVTLDESQSLDGGDVLPGFTLPLRTLFARVPRDEPPAPPARPKKKRRK